MATAPRDHSRLLHLELLLSVYDFLDQGDLLSAAGTCQRWRSMARMHHFFFYSISVTVDLRDAAFPRQLEDFCAAMRCAAERNVRVSVAADWRTADTSHWSLGAVVFSSLSEDVSAPTSRIISAIEAALPRLVKLQLRFDPVEPAALRRYVWDQLRRPAPVLRVFIFDIHLPLGIENFPQEYHSFVLPTLFDRHAPKLSHIVLGNVRLPRQPVVALSHASHVRLMTLLPDVHLPALFPKMQELSLMNFHHADLKKLCPPPATLSTIIAISVLGVPSNMEQLRSLASIPRMRLDLSVTDPSFSYDPLFQFPPGHLHLELHISDNGYPRVSVIIAGGALKRDFGMVLCNFDILHLIVRRNFRPLKDRINRLDICPQLLYLLPKIFDELPALDTFNVAWPRAELVASAAAIPPFSPPTNRVSCPKLVEMAFVDPMQNGKLDAKTICSVIKPGRFPVAQEYEGVRCINGLPRQVGEEFVVAKTNAAYAKLFDNVAPGATIRVEAD